MIKCISTWLLLTSLGVFMGYLFILGWDMQHTLKEKPPWSKPSSLDQVAPYSMPERSDQK
jgi:hypothetical protein